MCINQKQNKNNNNKTNTKTQQRVNHMDKHNINITK